MRRGTAALGLLVVLFMFLFILEPLPVHAAATLVQQTDGQSGCCTLSIFFPSNVASGDVVVVTILVDGGTLSSIADSRSSSFTQAASFICDSGVACYIYYATVSSSGADTVMLTVSAGSLSMISYIFEVSGVVAPPIVTALSTGSGASTATSSTSFQNGAFLLGTIFVVGAHAPPTFTNGPGFTFSNNPHCSCSLGEESSTSVSSPTTFPATITNFSGGTGWVEVGLVLNPPTTPPPPIPEYPLGLPILAILTIIGYGLIRRREKHET